jgi:hypothetical protein
MHWMLCVCVYMYIFTHTKTHVRICGFVNFDNHDYQMRICTNNIHTHIRTYICIQILNKYKLQKDFDKFVNKHNPEVSSHTHKYMDSLDHKFMPRVLPYIDM